MEPDAIRAGLEESVCRHVDGTDDVRVTIHAVPEGTGHSHETVPFEASFGDRTERLVARIEPGEHSVFPDTDLAREHRLRELVAGMDVPVPRARWFEDDASLVGSRFSVMEHVEGLVPSDNPPYTMGGWVTDATREEQERLWWSGLEAMARVHVEWTGPQDVFGPAPGLDGQLSYWEDYLRWASPDATLPAVDAALAWLTDHRPGGPERRTLCWGDSRIGNEMFRAFRCVGVLDWEMATLADPVMDLAWFLYFDELFSSGLGVPRPAGFASHEASIARWEEITGLEARGLDYYRLFAAFRFATILHRLGRVLVSAGRLPPDSDFPVNNFATAFLSKELDARGVRA